MNHKKKIAILGATGKLGKGLALRFGTAGHPLVFGTREIEKGKQAAELLSAQLNNVSIEVEDYAKAAQAADIIIVSVPYSAQSWVIDEIRNHVSGKIVITAIVAFDPTHRGEIHLPLTGSSAITLQHELGKDVHVISAFENIAASLLKDLNSKIDCDILVCGNNMEICDTVIKLINEIGLHGIYAGKLVNSVAVESLTTLLIAINQHYKVKNAGIRISMSEKKEMNK